MYPEEWECMSMKEIIIKHYGFGSHAINRISIMIYGYLRVSTDEQDSNNQKLGSLQKAESLGVSVMIGLLMMAYLGRRSLKNGYWANL